VNLAIETGTMWDSPTWHELLRHGRKGTLHLTGLHSDGNVHSHTDHLYAIVRQAASRIGPISLLDLETNEVTIVNVPVETPDDRLDFINTVVTADGKVLASSEGFGDVYLWDLDRPEEPTVIFEGIDGAIVRGDELVEPRVHAIAVLDDGRAVIATPVVNAAGDRVNTQYEILSDL